MGNGGRIALAALAGLGLFGGVVLLVPRPPAPELAPAKDPAAGPAASEASPEAASPPSFDAVRVAPDGSGLVAGQAEPGATVAVMAGGEVAAEVEADASGRFVAFLDLPPSAQPRELTLRAGAGASGESVILAPTPATSGAVVASQAQADEQGGPRAAQAEAVPAAGPLPSGEVAPSELARSEAPGARVPASEAPATEVAGAEAPSQAAVLLSDAEGVRVVQPALPPDADPEVLSNVAIDAIGYDGSGEVRLSGRGAAGVGQGPEGGPESSPGGGPGGGPSGGSVRVYLDNEPVAEAAIGPDGTWTSSLDGTAPGVYTLRVDQIGPGGEVLSRVETPFQREERDALAAAMADASDASAPGQTTAVRTVQPGNTLWAIARDRYGEPLLYVRVFELNRDRIRDPDLIYPGQVFVLPEVDGL